MNFGEFLYIQLENIKKQVRDIENQEKNWPMLELPLFSIKPD